MYISIIQVIVAICLVTLILLQERSSGLSGTFGGSETAHYKRRGMEKVIFNATIVFLVAFITISILNFVV